MPGRLSPGTFLSLFRHPRTGELLYDQPYPKQSNTQPHDDDPQDCVRRSASVDADMTQLIGYDIHGVVRVKIEVAEGDSAWWERLMLRYMRWRFGSPLRLMR
ncbi:MAG TPA: hypothetical protein VJO33_05130 [Gemmatimonadaceae bacterium]|nr:hypothetical protein [Gemmatimonadaceae bacterium]